LSEAIEILRMDADKTDEAFNAVLRAKCAIIATAVTAKLRVSEENFRQQRFDRLPELLKLIAEEERRLPSKLIEDALTQHTLDQ
jgi:hypothetical protein